MSSHRIVACKPAKATGGNLFVYDIETSGLDATKFIFGAAIDVRTGDESVFSDANAMRTHFERNAPCVAYAHNGNRYDLFSMFSKRECYEAKKVTSGTRIFELEINKVKYRDTKHLLPLSLAAVARSVGMEKGITPEAYIKGTINDFSEVEPADIDYCLIDCRILVEALKRLHLLYANLTGSDPQSIELPLTTASMAYRVWCATSWPEHWSYLDKKGRERRICTSRAMFNDCYREAEVGGRVQVFSTPGERVGHRGDEGGIVSFDANSLYPSVMFAEAFPDPRSIGKKSPTFSSLLNELNRTDRVCAAKVRVHRPEGVAGMLPGLDSQGRRDWTINEYEGWICEPELKLMLELGYIVREVQDIISARAIRPFITYVQRLYQLRLQLREMGDPTHNLCKLLLNSLYGRFGIKERPHRVEGVEAIAKAVEREDYHERYELRFHDGTAGEWPYLLDFGSLTKTPASQFFGFSSFILSYGRERLMRGILAAGDDVLYCDTDSVHLYVRSADKFANAMRIGQELDEWKQEQTEPIHSAVYWEAKAYVFYDENGDRTAVKHKGVRVKNDEGEWMTNAGDLRREQTHRTTVSLYEGLRRNLNPGTPITTVKRSRRFFDGS